MKFEQLINDLVVKIQSGQLLTFAGVDWTLVDDLINARDSEEFEERWLSAFQPIEARASELSIAEKDAIDTLREASYKAAFASSESPDIAAFVSDDMEMIARAVSFRINDPWLNGLWMEYKRDRFPNKNLEEIGGELHMMLG